MFMPLFVIHILQWFGPCNVESEKSITWTYQLLVNTLLVLTMSFEQNKYDRNAQSCDMVNISNSSAEFYNKTHAGKCYGCIFHV